MSARPEHHDGLCRPALAGPRALCRARRLCAPPRSTCTSASVRGSGCGLSMAVSPAAGAVIGYPGVPLRRRRRLLRDPHHRLRASSPASASIIGAGSAARPDSSCPSPTTRATTCLSLRGSPTMFYYVAARHDGRGLRAVPRAAAQPHRLLLAGDPREPGGRPARSASTPSATRCTRWCCPPP